MSWFWLRHKAKPPLRREEWLWACRTTQMEHILHKARRDRAKLVLVCPAGCAPLVRKWATSAQCKGLLAGSSFAPPQQSNFNVWLIDNVWARDPPTPVRPVVECMGNGIHRDGTASRRWSTISTFERTQCRSCNGRPFSPRRAPGAAGAMVSSSRATRLNGRGEQILRKKSTRAP